MLYPGFVGPSLYRVSASKQMVQIGAKGLWALLSHRSPSIKVTNSCVISRYVVTRQEFTLRFDECFT